MINGIEHFEMLVDIVNLYEMFVQIFHPSFCCFRFVSVFFLFGGFDHFKLSYRVADISVSSSVGSKYRSS